MNVTMPRLLTAGIATVAAVCLFGIPTVAENTSVNPDTAAVWVAGYGLELSGPDGVELVQCYQVADLGLTTVDC